MTMAEQTSGAKPAKSATKSATKSAKAAFQWDDPLRFDDLLTEDERLIRDTARGFAQDKLAPRVIDAFLQEKSDREIFREMGALGLLAVTIPEAYGGAEAGVHRDVVGVP